MASIRGVNPRSDAAVITEVRQAREPGVLNEREIRERIGARLLFSGNAYCCSNSAKVRFCSTPGLTWTCSRKSSSENMGLFCLIIFSLRVGSLLRNPFF